jgi:hypothetical protein
VVDDDDLLAGPGPVGAPEYPGLEQVGRDGVLGVFEGDHRGVLRNGAGQPERDRGSGIRDPVQPRGFLGGRGRGLRRVARCSRLFTSSMNAWQAASSSAKVPYWVRRLVSVGTMSALASFTDASNPPLAAGSACWQASTVTP